ncbi:MAG: 7TM domain-containing protein [Burkholderiales bacterium]
MRGGGAGAGARADARAHAARDAPHAAQQVSEPRSGSFLSLLIGLAFRETQLFWGTVLFTLLVRLGDWA